LPNINLFSDHICITLVVNAQKLSGSAGGTLPWSVSVDKLRQLTPESAQLAHHAQPMTPDCLIFGQIQRKSRQAFPMRNFIASLLS
jgi:hypothetical protein